VWPHGGKGKACSPAESRMRTTLVIELCARTRLRTFDYRNFNVRSTATGGFQSNRQPHRDTRAVPWLAVDGDGAAMCLHHAVGNAESQARAAPDRLRCEERLKNFSKIARGDANAIVPHLDFDTPRSVRSLAQAHRNVDARVPASFDRIDGVAEQVHPHL